jgi:hypothetical protein
VWHKGQDSQLYSWMIKIWLVIYDVVNSQLCIYYHTELMLIDDVLCHKTYEYVWYQSDDWNMRKNIQAVSPSYISIKLFWVKKVTSFIPYCTSHINVWMNKLVSGCTQPCVYLYIQWTIMYWQPKYDCM